jgi:hypothetical protein
VTELCGNQNRQNLICDLLFLLKILFVALNLPDYSKSPFVQRVSTLLLQQWEKTSIVVKHPSTGHKQEGIGNGEEDT